MTTILFWLKVDEKSYSEGAGQQAFYLFKHSNADWYFYLLILLF